MARRKAAVAGGKGKYRILHPISWVGERREAGEIIEMTAEQAAGIGGEYLAPVEGKKDGKTEPEPETPAEGSAAEEGKEIDI